MSLLRCDNKVETTSSIGWMGHSLFAMVVVVETGDGGDW